MTKTKLLLTTITIFTIFLFGWFYNKNKKEPTHPPLTKESFEKLAFNISHDDSVKTLQIDKTSGISNIPKEMMMYLCYCSTKIILEWEESQMN